MANPQITMTPDQVAQLRQITANGTANFAEGYAYISSIIQNSPNVDAGTKYWFQAAAQINGNQQTDSNIFIRSATARGLQWDGKATDGIQAISDAIAKA